MAKGYAIRKKDTTEIPYRSDDFNELDITQEIELGDDMVLLISGKDHYQETIEDLNHRLEEAESANIAKEVFLSNMSHDIRTPMNAIIGMTLLAKKNIDEKPKLLDSLNKIDTASSHLLNLINEVLDMSRINSGKMTVEEKLFSLSDLLHDTLTIITPQMEQKQHEFVFRTENILHEGLYGDIQRLRQIYVNIINNSVKYTNNNGKISVTISEEMKDDRCSLIFSCIDNGIGMSEDFIRKIFTPFERAGNSTMSGVEGTGLGMSIVKKLVDAMNGEIDIQSEPDKGTSIKIAVPLRYEDLKVSTDSIKDKSFLVVMPDDETKKKLEDVLNEYKIRFDEAQNLSDAIDVLTKAEFENRSYEGLLLGKIDETRGDSFDLASYFRKAHPEITIFYISAENWEELQYKANRSGIEHFIPLPFFRHSLIDTLNSVMSSGNEESDRHIPDLNGSNILLVEDNFINREIASELLRPTGANIDIAENGQEALDRFLASEDGHYRIILMDIQMPIMDGYTATEKIRSSGKADAKTVKIYAMSANIFAEDIARSKAIGMDDHIGKPIDFNRLMQILKQS